MALIELRVPGAVFWIIVFTLPYFAVSIDENSAEVEIYERKEVRKPSGSETNVFNFLRLFILRMIYGFANMIGVGDFLEDFAGGIFAPPTPEYDGLDYAGEDNDYKEYDDYDY